MNAQEDQMRRASAERAHRTPTGNSDADAGQIETVGQKAAEGYGPGLEYPSGGYPIAGEPPTGGPSKSACPSATGVAVGTPAAKQAGEVMPALGDAAGYAADETDEQGGADTNADDLSGTTDTDYSSQGDDSMLSDNIGSDSSSS